MPLNGVFAIGFFVEKCESLVESRQFMNNTCGLNWFCYFQFSMLTDTTQDEKGTPQKCCSFSGIIVNAGENMWDGNRTNRKMVAVTINSQLRNILP